MHGLRDLRGKGDTPERAGQARRFLNLAEGVTAPGDIRVLCGDFNVEPDSETLDILRQTGLVELVTSRGFTGTRSSHYPKAGRYADYMLVDPEQAVSGFDVVTDPEVSDHCPLVLRL